MVVYVEWQGRRQARRSRGGVVRPPESGKPDMNWTDQHQTEDAEDDDQILSEEFDDWVREGAALGEEDESEADQADTTVDEAESSAEDSEVSSEGDQARVASTSSGTVSRQGSDKPLMMDQCPRCDGRELARKSSCTRSSTTARRASSRGTRTELEPSSSTRVWSVRNGSANCRGVRDRTTRKWRCWGRICDERSKYSCEHGAVQ